MVIVKAQQQTYLRIKKNFYSAKKIFFETGDFCTLNGLEWFVVGAIAIVVILWCPAKIPELAKALDRAEGEFNKAANETPPKIESSFTMPPPPPLKSRDEVLLDAARTLGISTQGKTREQISEEISLKVKLLNAG